MVLKMWVILTAGRKRHHSLMAHDLNAESVGEKSRTMAAPPPYESGGLVGKSKNRDSVQKKKQKGNTTAVEGVQTYNGSIMPGTVEEQIST